jgi:hypothetical protein
MQVCLLFLFLKEFRYLCSFVKRFGVGLCLKDCNDLAERLRGLWNMGGRGNAAGLGFFVDVRLPLQKGAFHALGRVEGWLLALL